MLEYQQQNAILPPYGYNKNVLYTYYLSQCTIRVYNIIRPILRPQRRKTC